MNPAETVVSAPSLQQRFFAEGNCFGCGPANEHGLRLESFPGDGGLVARWQPDPRHEAFPDVLCGGIIGTLLDCHSNWTAWWALSERDGIRMPLTVTARYEVKLRRPTPLDRPLSLFSRAVEVDGERVKVQARLESGGVTTAECDGLFVRPSR